MNNKRENSNINQNQQIVNITEPELSNTMHNAKKEHPSKKLVTSSLYKIITNILGKTKGWRQTTFKIFIWCLIIIIFCVVLLFSNLKNGLFVGLNLNILSFIYYFSFS